MYLSTKNLIRTPITAVTGTAINIPMNPSIAAPDNIPNIIHTGCKPTLSPTNFGATKFPSITLPIMKIPAIIDML